ncbi:NADPH dehydrogenase [Methylobacterium crusticola]|uniref:NADPH dehydrogenase n=1 Tax=Methylobacterium crusticola TaxID=1697972 RepID=A0ABQ4R7B8_9HYPH|nr:NADH:flavin oxidoreductase/NADH oxidase [Methylobacterium crusticola]GJD52671.1 NADPH dehydrogenase [Methylobacterium crusticola]
MTAALTTNGEEGWHEGRPLLFQPFTIRGVTLKNRIVVSPMGTYAAEDGRLTPFQFAHYQRMAMGGAGLVIIEQTFVTRAGRVSNGDPGLWADSQIEPMAALVGEMKRYGARTAIQISHGGRKGGQQRAHEGNGPIGERDLAAGTEPLFPMGASAVPLSDGWRVPVAMSEAQIEGVIEAYVAGARRAVLAGFDLIELHLAHGYLLQSFLSPIANHRVDRWGGSLENRMRLPLTVVRRLRAMLPGSMPLFARLSVTDWMEGGWTEADSVVLARELKDAGVDLIDCSSGGNMRAGATNSNLARGPGYQVALSDRLRREAGIPTAAVGMIRTPAHAERILREGRSDLVCIGRQMLFDPFWAHHAAWEMGVERDFASWPEPYGWWLDKWARALDASGEDPLGPERFVEAVG